MTVLFCRPVTVCECESGTDCSICKPALAWIRLVVTLAYSNGTLVDRYLSNHCFEANRTYLIVGISVVSLFFIEK